tara:strand:- start:170 stop:664 length:495 start_codon:yes stop_codon:yes gene_type:complete
MDAVVALGAAVMGGLILNYLKVPGGLIIGAMLGAAIVTSSANLEVNFPSKLEGAAFIGVGASIGVLVTRDTLSSAKSALIPGLIAALLLIGAGLLIAFFLRYVGMAPPSEFLATSPGGISAVSAIAAEQKTGAVEVAVFHLIRVIIVLISIPVFIYFLARPSSP